MLEHARLRPESPAKSREIGMKVEEAEKQPRINTATLVICDPEGRVQAISAEAANGLLDAGIIKKHVSEIFSHDTDLGRWLTEHMELARHYDTCSYKSILHDDGQLLTARLDTLKREKEIFGFAIHILPNYPGGERLLSEGDSVVTRQQWHDLKNQLGGLKLYATLLKRKLQQGGDLEIVEKMLNGINAMIEKVAKIRKGE
ncbi:MAG TPA: hypothetical protein VNO70_19155 [Blastocatellia bacterium]|nr:hypothetical protein [Blastocatellia bacterium]